MNTAFSPADILQQLSTQPQSGRNYWWVNQNQTYLAEISGNFLWSPKQKKNGNRNPFYDFMECVRAGDVVFSFCDAQIKAVGIATGSVLSVDKPDFGRAGDGWAKNGWHVPVDYTELTNTICPKDHIELIRPLLPSKYAPLQANGKGQQSVYLAHLPLPMAEMLINLIGDEYAVITDRASALQDKAICDVLEEGIAGRTDIGATRKDQLVKARRGQGIFKINVRRNERACRVTGVTDPRNLRASHIKPWKDCSDTEKLHGCNGFMLAPHVDHLFDRGFISFADNGDLIISPALDRSILHRWGIPEVLNVGSVQHQAVFLAYHRAYVLKK